MEIQRCQPRSVLMPLPILPLPVSGEAAPPARVRDPKCLFPSAPSLSCHPERSRGTPDLSPMPRARVTSPRQSRFLYCLSLYRERPLFTSPVILGDYAEVDGKLWKA